MKEWFQYESGYVNIDKHNVYFTHSGNWSETKDLKEKGIQKRNHLRKFRIVFGYIIAILFLGLLFREKLMRLGSSWLIVFTVSSFLFTIYTLYKRHKQETGIKFKLPKVKIIAVEVVNNTVVLNFYNGINEEDELVLYGVSDKDITLLNNL